MKLNTAITATESSLTVADQPRAIATINPEYFQSMPIAKGSYPALQADKYDGVALDSKLHLGYSINAVNLLGADAMEAMKMEIIEVDYGSGTQQFFTPSAGVRWIPLAFPAKWIEDRSNEKQVVYRPTGTAWNEHCRTVCRLFLAAIVGDKLVLGDDGQPSVSVLTFRSLRTNRIDGKEGSLLSLNTKLLEIYKVKQNAYIAHLASVVITCQPAKFTSKKETKKSSIGPDFVLSKAQMLPPNVQAEVMALLKDEVLQQAMLNPFGATATMPDDDVELCF